MNLNLRKEFGTMNCTRCATGLPAKISNESSLYQETLEHRDDVQQKIEDNHSLEDESEIDSTLAKLCVQRLISGVQCAMKAELKKTFKGEPGKVVVRAGLSPLCDVQRKLRRAFKGETKEVLKVKTEKCKATAWNKNAKLTSHYPLYKPFSILKFLKKYN